MLSLVAPILGDKVRSTWITDMELWGQRVALYRQYEEGNHRAKMTPQMQKMLRVEDTRLDRFNANYCEIVPSAMSERLIVSTIDANDEAATAWGAEMLAWNRFDGLQMDVHSAAVVDGDTFVMVAWDKNRKMPMLTQELAYDGDCGMIPIYDKTRRTIIAAVKFWWVGDSKYCNVYLPGQVQKLLINGDNKIEERDPTEPWLGKQGEIGVPIIHFRNRARQTSILGKSELNDCIPLQDALNRTLVSMVMTSELSAFQNRVAKGFTPPNDLAPGSWIVFGEDGMDNTQQADASVLPQAQLVPFINQAEFLVDQIGAITRTPLQSAMGSSAQSGEALKQRESGLLGKVQRAQVKFGNAWEDVMGLAARVQNGFGIKAVPEGLLWRCVWRDAQMRNDDATIKNSTLLRDLVGDREALRIAGRALGYDEAKIDAIMKEKAEAAGAMLGGLTLPGYEQFRVN